GGGAHAVGDVEAPPVDHRGLAGDHPDLARLDPAGAGRGLERGPDVHAVHVRADETPGRRAVRIRRGGAAAAAFDRHQQARRDQTKSPHPDIICRPGGAKSALQDNVSTGAEASTRLAIDRGAGGHSSPVTWLRAGPLSKAWGLLAALSIVGFTTGCGEGAASSSADSDATGALTGTL